MILSSDSFMEKGAIPGRCAFAVADAAAHAKLPDNRNPHLAWQDLPAGTRSLALVCCDSDVPSKPDDVNKADRQIPATLPRTDFYHWLLVDLKPDAGPIEGIRGAELLKAIKPHVLGSAKLTGVYALNPAVKT